MTTLAGTPQKGGGRKTAAANVNSDSALIGGEGGIDGRPLQIAVDLISEDPHQPRSADNPGFSDESLRELAQSIGERGIKQPLSLRTSPEAPGRYIINHGARRYRAACLLNLATVPAFIDQDYDEFDQVVENLQRNELTPREIADFISRELNKGFKKGEIARRIGKSNAFVSQHLALTELPAPIADAFQAGRVQDVTAINELAKLHEGHAEEVEQWLSNPDVELTRAAVKQLREFVTAEDSDSTALAKGSGASTQLDDQALEDPVSKPKKAKDDPTKLRKAIVMLRHEGKDARLLYDRRPKKRGCGWIRYEKGGTEASVDLSELKLVGLLEG